MRPPEGGEHGRQAINRSTIVGFVGYIHLQTTISTLQAPTYEKGMNVQYSIIRESC